MVPVEMRYGYDNEKFQILTRLLKSLKFLKTSMTTLRCSSCPAAVLLLHKPAYFHGDALLAVDAINDLRG